MWVEHICKWLGEANHEVYPDDTYLSNVVALVQAVFHDWDIVEEGT